MLQNEKTLVISLGGSLIVPKQGDEFINVKFVKEFCGIVRDYVKKGFRFVIVTGGGSVCRKYQDAMRQIGSCSDDRLDEMGIEVTRLNATFIQQILYNICSRKIITGLDKSIKFDKPVIMGCGGEKGRSSDHSMVAIAAKLKVNRIVNLSYGPCKLSNDPNLTPIPKLTKMRWSELAALAGKKWTPGMNTPFDPKAIQLAKKSGMVLYDLCGWQEKNFRGFLDGKEFTGLEVGGDA